MTLWQPQASIDHPDRNPFPHAGKWYWRDETGDLSEAFDTQRGALRDLLDYLDYLDTGKLPWKHRWRRFKKLVREFIHS